MFPVTCFGKFVGFGNEIWLVGFALGQVCALMNAASGISSAALVDRGANFPAWQAWLAYVLLAVVYVPLWAWRRRGDAGAKAAAAADSVAEVTPEVELSSPSPGEEGRGAKKSTRTLGRYVLLAFIDTQAMFCILKAFQYTSLTSVTLLDCAAIPFSMALAAAVLGGRYTAKHVGGGAVAISGLVILVLADATGGSADGSNAPLGDALVLLAAALYASSNVLQEGLLLEGAPTIEVLAALGGFGTLISGLQCSVFESAQLREIGALELGLAGGLELAAFAFSLFAFYSLCSAVLRRCGSAAFNIGMLSSDLWAVVARVLFFEGFGSWGAALAFGAAFVTVGAGLVLFAAAG